MSRLGAVIAVAFGSFSLACGGEDPEPQAPASPPLAPAEPTETTDATADEAAPPRDPEWGLDFSIIGREVPMTARAELKVVEGERDVHVAITGRTSGTDVMMIDLTFDGLENALGPHQVPFSLPEGGEHVANGNLDGTWYYSQGGTIDLSVGQEGTIQGRFDIALARGEMGAPEDPVEFVADDVAVPLLGEFSGEWILNCHSRLAGHQTLIVGGKFCDSLEF